ncbi:S41 family peptidase [Caulobacter sp. 17J65-9]|uniref:S41 family peptidase n=1 Tax=Caulobacter sp. 17J65-9 TaxID=2709382 RepID=UPI0013CD99EA|nr:S41 family peptidase [Caulobacter sp. 17J65-9]NEX92016.1 hypothetical protein [Caulobacter sp. 17J65-9]
MSVRGAAAGLLFGLALAGTAAAQTPSDAAAAHWRALTEIDLDAAFRLIRDNHPGAAPELGDEAFQTGLAHARETALARAAEVQGYTGYAAVMNGFATDLGDKHIWARQSLRPASYAWTGIVVARRGGAWRVAVDARPEKAASLEGARLVGCDGRDADALAKERVGGFRAVWSIEAQRIQNAPWLLLDDGNPFLKRPAACEFEQEGRTQTVGLEWRAATGAVLQPQLSKAVSAGEAGFGVRRFEGGWWISLQSLDDRARPVIDEVAAKAAEIRTAPIVVLDLRGNGGGSSAFGVELASALTGEAYVARNLKAEAGDCPALWRATSGNLEAVRDFRLHQAPSRGPDTVAYYEALEREIAAAIEQGRPFDEPVRACPGVDRPEPKPASGKGSLLKGRLVVLTDNACFSSCLLVTRDFRRLGALHLGEATDAATRYMEVREAPLPSGLGWFSTLQKVALGAPRQIGPFIPEKAFGGDIADTAALEAWVAQTAR